MSSLSKLPKLKSRKRNCKR